MFTALHKKRYTRFLLLNLIVTVSLLIAWNLLEYLFPAGIISPETPWILLFFLCLNLIIYYLLLKVSACRFSKFINLFLLTTTLKLLVFLILIIIYSFLHRSDAITFILNFFVIYLIYTSIEVTSILNTLNALKKKH